MGHEKRNAQRFALEAKVEVCIGAQRLVLITTDISDTGAFLSCNGCEPPAVGTQLTLQLQQKLGDEEAAPIVPAIVVRTTPQGIGVKFL